MPKTFTTADEAFADACREWLKSCSCAPPTKPHKCKECTKAFLKAVRKRAKMFDAATGENSLRAISARGSALVNAVSDRARAQMPRMPRLTMLGHPTIVWRDGLTADFYPNGLTAKAVASWFAEQQAKGIKAVVDRSFVNQDSRTLDMGHSALIADPQLGDDVLIVDYRAGGITGPQDRVKLTSRSMHPDGSIRWGYDPIVDSTDTSR